MTVGALIEKLKEMPQDIAVRVGYDGEVTHLEKTTFYGDLVVYLNGNGE